MDLHEWAEDVTSGIESNRKAREVRRELLGHLASIADELIAEGLNSEQAEIEAVSRMGNPGWLQVSLRQVVGPPLSRTQILGFVLAAALTLIGAVGSLGDSLFAGLLLLGGLVMAGAASSPGDRQAPFAALGRGFKRHVQVVATWSLLGLLAGAEPVWSAGPSVSQWSWIWPVCLYVIVPAAGAATLWAFSRSGVLASLGTLGAGLLAYAGVGIVSGWALSAFWHLSPSTSAVVDWYTTPGAFLPWYAQPFASHLGASIGFLTLSGVVGLGLVWTIRTGFAPFKAGVINEPLARAGKNRRSPVRS